MSDPMDTRFDRIDRQMQAILDDLHVLKGHAPGRAARDHVETILDQLGLTYTTMLDRRDRLGLVGGAPDIAAADRQDFYRADLVVEAEYTATRRDSDRALRNAGYLADRTGRPAHAVVASLRVDRDVQALVDAGTVHWYRLTEADLDPE